MKLGLYIHSATLISAQHTFGNAFPDQVVSSDSGMMLALEPDYSPYIPPVPIRRMSRLLKMAIAAGVKALLDAGVERPAAILTGSGRASMSDTERFLSQMIQSGHGALNPTPFIQSTYNSPNGWLAQLSGCTGYNTTYAHRGLSMEWALIDAAMLFAEGAVNAPVLVGSYDEMTPTYRAVKDKIGYWKASPPNSLSLLHAADTPGTIGGEGAAGFVVSKDANKESACCIASLTMLQHPRDAKDVRSAIYQALEESGMLLKDVDAVIVGMNGDSRSQEFYAALQPEFQNKTLIGFKHLSGEYDTAVGFALWLSHRTFSAGNFPEICVLQRGERCTLKTVLLINHYILGSWSVMVLRKA